jgi:DNA-binding XRE family transcriptional regulator
MNAYYPHKVDYGKPTNGGLHRGPPFVNLAVMNELGPPFADVGARLIALRKSQSDLNQKDWAGKHGFSQTQYNNWENGTRRIPVDDAERLCQLYGVSLDFIYRGRRDGLPESVRNTL